MPPSKKKFYAVAMGLKTGVFESWDECSRQVTGFPNACFKSFKTREEAQAFVEEKGNAGGSSGSAVGGDDGSLADARKSNEEILPCNGRVAVMSRKRRSPSPVSSPSSSLPALTMEVTVGDVDVLQDVGAEWMKARQLEAVEVYVDGACRANGKGKLARGGYGGYYGENDPRSFSLPLPTDETQTNNRAELYAVIHVLRTACEAESCYNLRIFSDSKYTISGADFYLDKWLKTGFWGSKGSKVANCDLWRTLNNLRTLHATRYNEQLVKRFGLVPAVARRLALKLALEFVHVKGHSGVHGNVMADRLAVMGADRKYSPPGNE